MPVNFYNSIDPALYSSSNPKVSAILAQLIARKQTNPNGSLNVLSQEERINLTALMQTLPKGTQFKNVGYELAKTDPYNSLKISPDGSTGRLGVKFNLNKVECGDFPTSVCGGKRPVTYQRFKIKKPNKTNWENTFGISDAIMLIGDSPVHGHNFTDERYTAIAPTDKNGKPVSFDPNKPIALMYLEDPKSRNHEVHPIYVGDTMILKPGLIHGSTAIQGTRTKFHLQFSPGLVLRPDKQESTRENNTRIRNRDEKIVYESTLARIKQIVSSQGQAA
jgi:hypothetical protein